MMVQIQSTVPMCPHPIGQQVIVASMIRLTLMTLCVIVGFYTVLFIKHLWGESLC